MTSIRRDFGIFWLPVLVLFVALFVAFGLYSSGGAPVVAAEPMATATPTPAPPCEHVATAGTIKIFYCEDIYLFINDLGFMAFEP